MHGEAERTRDLNYPPTSSVTCTSRNNYSLGNETRIRLNDSPRLAIGRHYEQGILQRFSKIDPP